MASFDVLSKVDLQALDNAINSARRELENRYDLRGTNSQIELDKKALTVKLATEDHLKLDAILNILLERSTKQKVDVKSYDLSAEPVPSGKLLSRLIKIKQGIDRETAKKITKFIKGTCLKVQAQVMDDMVRVTGKKIDDLQGVISGLRGEDFGMPLQYENMKS